MPIYEYECNVCGAHLEVIQKMSDAPLTECPKCARPTLEKLLSQSSFAFKGDGWYVSDYARKSGTNAKSETAAGTTGGTAKETTTESSAAGKEAASGGSTESTPAGPATEKPSSPQAA